MYMHINLNIALQQSITMWKKYATHQTHMMMKERAVLLKEKEIK